VDVSIGDTRWDKMKDDIVQAQMFSKINRPLLTSSDHTWLKKLTTNWVPMHEDNVIECIEAMLMLA
jgi:hypothetical protein